MARVYNFSAGPSMLPLPVLERASRELPDYGTSGQSVMEMSHRSPEYEQIISHCENLLRHLMEIPENYKVIFLQGGASLQFSMVPLNLMITGKADYIITGQWAKKAAEEAKKVGRVQVVASSEDKNYSYIPDILKEKCSSDADYFYICYNNTIYGTVFPKVPDTGKVPLVADMSSCFLSEPLDVSKFGVIFAGAQKNFGPAGVTVVIIREDLIGKAKGNIPTMLDYKIHVENRSMYNTPPTYSIYICGLVLEWIQEQGGLTQIAKINREKSAILYDYLDNSKLFRGTVESASRSRMNIPFIIGDTEKEKQFITQAQAAGFINLKGHRSVGGMRASIYNAMPLEGVRALVDFMKQFEWRNN